MFSSHTGVCASARHFDLWDFTTVTPNFKSKNLITQTSVANSVVLGDSGTKMYVIGATDVYQYTLGTAWEVATATYDSVSFDVTTEAPNPQCARFSADGTKMYVIGTTNSTVYQYTLGTAWDLSTIGGSPVANSFDVSNETVNNEFTLAFGNSGTKMYVADGFSEIIYQYTLDPAWEVATATYDTVSLDVGPEVVTAFAINISSDGTKLYVLDSGGGLTRVIVQYELGTAWDISTAAGSPIANSYNPRSTQPQATDLWFSDDGLQCYITSVPATQAWVKQHTLDTAWDISTASITEGLLETQHTEDETGEDWPRSIRFNPDGTRMYVLGTSLDFIYQYTLFTPYELSTASYDSVSFDINPPAGDGYGFDIADDGSRIYVVTWPTKNVFEYILGTPWDLSTMGGSPVANSFYVGDNTDTPLEIQICDSGTKMYAQDSSSIDLYTLGTAYDVSSATYDSTTNFPGLSIYGFHISPKGNRVAVLDSNNDSVKIYRLTVLWDISTAVLHTSHTIGEVASTYQMCRIGKRGTRLYISHISVSSVWEFILT